MAKIKKIVDMGIDGALFIFTLIVFTFIGIPVFIYINKRDKRRETK